MADAQPITLAPLVVPDTDLEGVNADKVFDVTAADVVGYLGETDGASNTDFYSFTAQAGTLINFQLMSVVLTRSLAPAGTAPTDDNQGPFDTYLVIYNSSGQVIDYNDDSFQDADSSIIDLTLPTTGTYYAMVTSSPKSVSLSEPLDRRLRALHVHVRHRRATHPAGDTMYAGSGDDTIIAGAADDTIEAHQPQDTIIYGSGTVTLASKAPSLNVSAGPNQMVDEGSAVTLTGSFLDPSGDGHAHLRLARGRVQRPEIADGTGSTFTFTPGNAGTYTVTFTVSDQNGGEASAVVHITSDAVQQEATSTELRSSASHVVYGEAVTFTATVTGKGVPTGSVSFYAGEVRPQDQLGTGTLSISDGVDRASITLDLGPGAAHPRSSRSTAVTATTTAAHRATSIRRSSRTRRKPRPPLHELREHSAGRSP